MLTSLITDSSSFSAALTLEDTNKKTKIRKNDRTVCFCSQMNYGSFSKKYSNQPYMNKIRVCQHGGNKL